MRFLLARPCIFIKHNNVSQQVCLEDYSGLGTLWQARSEVFSGHRLHETPPFFRVVVSDIFGFFTSTWGNDPISPAVGSTTQLVFLWCCLVQAFNQLRMCLRFCAKAIYDMWAMWGNASWSMLNSFVFCCFQMFVNPQKANCWTNVELNTHITHCCKEANKLVGVSLMGCGKS